MSQNNYDAMSDAELKKSKQGHTMTVRQRRYSYE
jgi:hypothetical protein